MTENIHTLIVLIKKKDCTWIFMSKLGRNIGLCKKKEQIGVAWTIEKNPAIVVVAVVVVVVLNLRTT